MRRTRARFSVRPARGGGAPPCRQRRLRRRALAGPIPSLARFEVARFLVVWATLKVWKKRDSPSARSCMAEAKIFSSREGSLGHDDAGCTAGEQAFSWSGQDRRPCAGVFAADDDR